MSRRLAFDDAVVFVEDDGAARYRALKPRLAAGPDGKPQINLLIAGPTAFLQLTAALGLPSERLDALSKQVAEALELDAPPILQPLPDRVVGVALLLRDKAGADPRELAKGKASGAPPNTTIFNVMVSESDRALIQKALDGERGLLSVRFQLETSEPVSTETVAETADVSGYAEAELGACFNRTISEISRSGVHSVLKTQGVTTGSADAELDLSEIEPAP